MLNRALSYMAKSGYLKLVCCLIISGMTLMASGHDGKQAPVTTKVIAAPVSIYYQWLMFGIAVVYTLFLVIRAKKRKSRSRTPQL